MSRQVPTASYPGTHVVAVERTIDGARWVCSCGLYSAWLGERMAEALGEIHAKEREAR